MANAPTGRNVEVKMRFTADAAQAKGEMAATRKEVEKLGTEARKTQAEMNKAGGGGGGGSGGPGGGNGPNNFASGLAKATAVVAAFRQVIEGAAKAMAAYYGGRYDNKTLGAVTEGVNSALGGAPQWLADQYKNIRYSKSADDQRRGYLEEDRFGVRMGVQAGYNQQRNSMYEQNLANRDSYEAQMGIARNAKLWHGQFGSDPGQTDPRFKQSIEQIAGTEAGVVVGERAYNRADAETKRLRDLVEKAQGKVANFGGPIEADNPFKNEARATKVRMANIELLQRENELRAAIETKNKAGVDLEQKRSQFRQANLNYAKAELEIAKEKESKAKSQATEFGMMSGGDKLALKYALQQAQSQGIGALPEESRQLLARSGLTGEFAAKESERSVQDDPVYQSIVRALGDKTSTERTADKIKIETQIDLDTNIDAEKLAEGMKLQWDQFFDKMNPLIEKIANQQLTIALNQRKQAEK